MTSVPGRPDGPSGVTEAVASRYREILPDCFVVETNGPVLSLKVPGHSSLFFGNLILRLPLLPRRRRLEEFAKEAFGRLPSTVAHVREVGVADVLWPALGTNCHVLVTEDEVRIWYGLTDDEDEAVLTVRPIPRSELGL